MPYLTILTLRLDKKYRLKTFHTDKLNLKQQFLADPTGQYFPWPSSTTSSIDSYLRIENKKVENDETTGETMMKSQQQQQQKDPSKSIENDNYDDDSLKNQQKQEKIIGNKESESMSSSSSLILDQILNNLISCSRSRCHGGGGGDPKQIDNNSSSPRKIRENNLFLFILFGSNKSNISKTIVKGLVQFWNQYHVKHRFDVIYLTNDNFIDDSIYKLIGSADWFTLSPKASSSIKVFIISVSVLDFIYLLLISYLIVFLFKKRVK